MQSPNIPSIQHGTLSEKLIVNVHTVNEEMTISQVIKYFSKYHILFTKTMIQNYIRIGLLPGPVEKRYYTQNHLILLYIIYHLKDCFSLDEMKTVFSPIFKDMDTFEDDLISPTQLYEVYLQLEQYIQSHFQVGNREEEQHFISQTLLNNGISTESNESICKFIYMLYYMIQTVCLHQVATGLIDEWYK